MSGHAFYRVRREARIAHPLFQGEKGYPLLPGDILTRHPDGSWVKVAPGLGLVFRSMPTAIRIGLDLERLPSCPRIVIS